MLELLKALGVLASLLQRWRSRAGWRCQRPRTGPTPDAHRHAPNATAGSSQPGAGPQSPIRRRFMEVCKALLPAHGTLTAGQKAAGAKGTGCGEFPGRVFGRVPVTPPGQPGAFKVNVSGAGICYLTTPMTAWAQFAKAVDIQYGARTWIPFTSNRPFPGDIYILEQVR